MSNRLGSIALRVLLCSTALTVGTTVTRDAEAEVPAVEIVHVRVRSTLRTESTLFRQDDAAGWSQVLCAVPCEVDVPRGSWLRAVSGLQTHDFKVTAHAEHQVDFVVEEGRAEGLRIGGALMLAVGILSSISASIVVSFGNQGEGIPLLIGSAALAAGGIVMIACAPNGIGVSQTARASLAPAGLGFSF